MKHLKKFNENINEATPTAVEFLQNFTEDPDDDTIYEAMIAFAKMHVEKALNSAADNGDVDDIHELNGDVYYVIDKNSIIKSYPLENIK